MIVNLNIISRINLFFLCFIFIFTNLEISAQVQNDFLNENVSRIQLKEYLPIKSTKFHSAIQPYEFLDSTFTTKEDSLFQNSALSLTAKKNSNNLHFEISPIALLRTGFYSDNGFSSNHEETALVGFKAKSSFKNKLFVRASVFGGKITENRFSRYQQNVYPGLGELNTNDSFIDLANYNAALTYTPNDIFAFQIGKGKHKFGDGYHSLLLSENAVNYPYAKIRTRIWDIEYINLFSTQRSAVDNNNTPFSSIWMPYEYKRKFTSSHLLSWNINQDINVYFFETIIWQHEDTLSQRGFDINYLNPLIFFRPVEFAVGSSDNAIVGAGSSWKATDKLQIYGQFVVDEMVFKRFINRTGWWANKYGAQLGFKVFDPFKTKDTYFQMEWNQVRPFTYSHGSVQQNYAHFDQPLAHPAGANFYEFLGLFVKNYKRYQFTGYVNFTLKGNDIPAFDLEAYQNLGGDIFHSYRNPFNVYGNVVGQGNTVNNLSTSVQAAYLFDEKNDGRVSLQWVGNYVGYDSSDDFFSNLRIGLSMGFGSRNLQKIL